MAGLSIYHLRFVVEARDAIRFGTQPGVQLRGALYAALREQSCPGAAGTHDPAHSEYCPVCWLLAREDMAARRGKDVPRPFTVRPAYGTVLEYSCGTSFQFGITLFGKAFRLFPYLVLALPQMGNAGIGATRGRFAVRSVESVSLLNGAYEVLMQPDFKAVRQPTLWVTPEQILEAGTRQDVRRVTLRFVTPTRLTENGKPVRTPSFRIVVARLLERLDTLRAEYGETPEPSPYADLVAQADRIALVKDCTVWQEIHSYSARTDTSSPISGFVGEATYEGDLTPFLPWLLWGQCIQIGKDTVKGNGVIEVLW